MTNLVKFADTRKADVVPHDQFEYKLRIEVYFKDRSKQLYEFLKATPNKMLLGDHQSFVQESYRFLYAELDQNRLLMTWPKTYLITSEGSRQCFESLPMLHFGLTVEHAFI